MLKDLIKRNVFVWKRIISVLLVEFYTKIMSSSCKRLPVSTYFNEILNFRQEITQIIHLNYKNTIATLCDRPFVSPKGLISDKIRPLVVRLSYILLK